MKFTSIKTKTILAVALSATLIGCSDDNDTPAPLPEPPPPPPIVEYTYDVVVTNLTNAQPMSPVAVIAHDSNYSLFNVGDAVTVGLEQVAESGDNSVLIEEANAAGAFTTGSGMGILTPSSSETISITITEDEAAMAYVSLTTMLVNTNDAITAARNVGLANMAVGDSVSFTTLSYDTGTEANSEAAGTIPGPADGGEGFNAARDDIADQITLHGGVVTADDGLMTSVLGQMHRWDNPVLRVTISRTEQCPFSQGVYENMRPGYFF